MSRDYFDNDFEADYDESFLDDLLGEMEELSSKPAPKRSSKGRKKVVQKKYTPRQIYEHLNQYVVGQEKAKEILAVAFYNHLKQLEWEQKPSGDVEIEKSNVLLVGPSGSGKTHLIKQLARLFELPYAIADATSLTESGYVGNDVESVLQALLNSANGNLALAERGIVFIDEIDKKASKGQENTSITRDVSGEGVQQALLKLIEGSKVEVQLTGARRHPYGDSVEMDTSKILFIVGGAFPGIEKIIKNRLQYHKKSQVGLALSDIKGIAAEDVAYNDIIDQVSHEDLRSFGMIPEFLGRMPIICPLKELHVEELCRILTEPKNALVKQYQALFMQDKLNLEFEAEALQLIAETAIKNKTGARGLRSIMEKVLLQAMFELPETTSRRKVKNVKIDKAYVCRQLERELGKNTLAG